MSDDDGISNLSWPEYTEEDFQEIDRLCEAGGQNGVGLVHGAPTSPSTELPPAADEGIYKIKEEAQAAIKSPFAQFRKRRGYFTVTDLVAPVWCEVQFDYGLRQFRNKPVKQRPQSFVSSKGKTITVKKEIAVKNEKVLDKGKTVHRKLEKEVHKEEVLVKVKTREEIWALHLLDSLVRLKSSKTTSVCRELPVWGIVHDHAIFGIIDELRLETCTGATGSDSQSEKQQTQTKLDSFILSAKGFVNASSGSPQHILNIVDNKTRRSPNLPSHVDTLPSRLQVMLYWLLLNQTLSRNGTSFGSFCAQTGADLHREFSQTFITEMSALVLGSELSLHFLDAKCLHDMDFPYRETIKDMGLDEEGCVSKRLSLVYRLRGHNTITKKPRSTTIAAKKSKDQVVNSIAIREVADEPSTALDGGDVKIVPPMDGTVETEEATQLEESPKTTEESEAQVGPAETKANASSSRKRKRRQPSTSSTSSSEAPADTSADKTDDSGDDPDTGSFSNPSPFILGTKKFQYNETLLHAHLASILAWWHGKRPPHGVSIEDVGRCNSCEYQNGCEWREQKALELLEKTSSKSAQKNGTVE